MKRDKLLVNTFDFLPVVTRTLVLGKWYVRITDKTRFMLTKEISLVHCIFATKWYQSE